MSSVPALFQPVKVAALFLLTLQLPAAVATQGSVRSAGRPIPGAAVTAAKGEKKVATLTDETGRYRLDGLEPGDWLFQVKITAFSTAERTIRVAEMDQEVNWTLDLKGKAPAKEPAVPELAAGPLPGDLQEMEPLPAASAEADSTAGPTFLVSGSLSRGLQVAADSPGESESKPSRSSKKSAKAPKQPSPALFGGGASGDGDGLKVSGVDRGRRKISQKRSSQNSFGNKSGGALSSIRGAAYWTQSVSSWNARPFSLTGLEAPRPDLGVKRADISIGGPLQLGRLLSGNNTDFFVSFSAARLHRAYTGVARMPSPLERAGDFSASSVRGPVTIYDPLGVVPFAGNRVPANRVDDVSTGLLPYLPLPNQGLPALNYMLVTSVPARTTGVGLRLGHSLSRVNRLNFVFNRLSRSGESAQLYGFRDTTEGRGFTTDLGWTKSLTPQLVLKLKGSFRRAQNEVLPFFAYKTDVAAALLIQGTSRDPVNYGPPNLSFTNFGKLSDASPMLRRDQSFSLSAALSWNRNSHTVATGGDFRSAQINLRTDQNGRGAFSFSGLATSAFDAEGFPAAKTGYDFADFLLGLPSTSSLRYGSGNNYFRGTDWSVWFQDEWRALPNLTLSMGLRYEFAEPLSEKSGLLANLDVAPNFTAVATVTPLVTGTFSGPFPAALVDPDRNNFSPRLGLAWRPTRRSRTQIRAGYGWYYDGSIYTQLAPKLASQPPFAVTASQSTSQARWLTLGDGLAPYNWQKITNTFAVDRSFRVGYAQTWNLAVQRDLSHSLVVEAGYLGTKGTRLDVQRMPNRAPRGTPLTAEQRRLIGNAVGFTLESSDGNSIFHAGQVRLTRRFSRGISVNALYTFSRSIDNASSFGGVGSVVAQNDRDLRAERGLSSFDRRHVLAVSYILTSPVGDRGSWVYASGPMGKILRDWTLEGFLIAQSGEPYTARVLGNRSDSGGTGVVGSGRADATGEAIGASSGFFNLAAFSIPATGFFGNVSRNTIPGPAQIVQNVTFGRSFHLGERLRLRVRAEVTNLSNRVSYTNVGTVINAVGYGLPLGAAPMRTVSLGLRFRF